MGNDVKTATCGEAIIRLLEKYGVDTGFGIPGVHTVELYRGLGDSTITHVTPRHEQGAGMMAYGYALATGRVAACFLITGPGLLNAATAIAEATSDSVPMLVIAANNNLAEIGMGEGRLHEIRSQNRIAEQISGFACQILDQRSIPAALARAFATFEGGRPGAACLSVPHDMFAEPSVMAAETWPTPPRPHPDAAAVARAADLLGGAERPLILLGGGAWEASGEATALCQRLDCPVVTTAAGKGIVSEDHPLSLGATLPFKPVRDYFEESDAVLAVGTEMAETDILYAAESFMTCRNLIRVDIDPAQLTRSHRPEVPILGDARATLGRLLDALGAGSGSGDGQRTAADLRAGLVGQWAPESDKHKRLLDVLRRELDDDAMVSTDATQIAYTGNHYYRARKPRTWFHPLGFGTLGTGLPAAIGAKIGAPGRQVVCISGDGGFLFTVQELATAAELGLAIPILIWNNRGLGEIARYMDDRGIARVGVDPLPPDFPALARGFGCHGLRPQSLEEVAAALGEALEADRPTVIEIDSEAGYLDQ